MPTFQERLGALQEKAAKLLAKSGHINEQETKSALVTPMLRVLGWDCEEPDEVRMEYHYKPQDNPVDYALMIDGRPRLFVEAKALGRDLGEHKWCSQVVNYANAAGVEWCALTDGNLWHIYKSNAPGDIPRKLLVATCLHSPDGEMPAYEPGFVLSLLSRAKIAENEIENLWRRLDVDRRGLEALSSVISGKDSSLVRLVQKHSGLPKGEVLAFLERVHVTVDSSLRKFASPKPMPSPQPETSALGLPTPEQIELPLLRAILRLGDEINLAAQGPQINRELADEFKLTEKQREALIPNRKKGVATIWSGQIRRTRVGLRKKGDLDYSRGVWTLTEQGRRRAQAG